MKLKYLVAAGTTAAVLVTSAAYLSSTNNTTPNDASSALLGDRRVNLAVDTSLHSEENDKVIDLVADVSQTVSGEEAQPPLTEQADESRVPDDHRTDTKAQNRNADASGSDVAGGSPSSTAPAPSSAPAPAASGSAKAEPSSAAADTGAAAGSAQSGTTANKGYDHTTSIYKDDEVTLWRVEYYDSNNKLIQYSDVVDFDSTTNSYTENIYSYTEESGQVLERTDVYVNGELASSTNG